MSFNGLEKLQILIFYKYGLAVRYIKPGDLTDNVRTNVVKLLIPGTGHDHLPEVRDSVNIFLLLADHILNMYIILQEKKM